MVDTQREGFNLLVKFIRGAIKSEDSTEVPEEIEQQPSAPPVNVAVEPMTAYWENDLKELKNKNQPFIDQFLKDVSLNRIPDTTEEPVTESHYKFEKLNLLRLRETLNINNWDAPETPKTSTGISSSGRDAGVVAGIVVAVISGVIILAALIAAVMYRHYVHRNVTSMNFDNPVYRKTTEDQFAIEKNGYAPGSKLYPSTVGEEAKEPLNTPGTNDFV